MNMIAASSKGSSASRREFLHSAAALTAAAGFAPPALAAAAKRKAQIAITLDLEMSRNFPNREDTHWDYEKGNLNEPTKNYSVAAADRVRQAGGKLHFFLVGRALEQPSVQWLKELAAEHPVGNHTYDHVNVRATKIPEVQFRFQRSPWLAGERSPSELIEENVRLCTLAMQQRLGVKPRGFRTPGGFSQGLKTHPEVRAMLLRQGFRWVSSMYPAHARAEPQQRPSAKLVESIVRAHEGGQPFTYDDGLVEIPMSPISDIGAFRTGRWKLEWFLDTIRQVVEWTIEHGAVFDFLGHPSCLYVTDPKLRVIDMICQMAKDAGERAELVTLGDIAASVPRKK